MTTKWIANARHHGTLHPEGHGVYFSVLVVGRISGLSGYVEPEIFRDLCERFSVTDPTEREPPEPDGECYRGGEAAAALAESQARIQRELK